MKQSLNYNWNFIPCYSDEFLAKLPSEVTKVNIPHTVKEVPYNYFSEQTYQFISTYEKFFDVENFNNKRKYFLRFEGFMVKAKIYLNNKYLGEHVSIYIPVELDVTDYIKEKDNRLLVILDSKEDSNYPPFGFALDYLTFGGIYREVYLVSEPQTYLRNIYVYGDMLGEVKITYDKIGEDKLKIRHAIYKNDLLVNDYFVDSFKVPNIELWDIDNPVLYEVRTEIECNEEKETYITKIGFRDIEFNNTGFYLNKKKIKLIGLNRHQGYPYMGYAASKSLQEDDAYILKNEVGVNVIRTSHYPQSEHFLNKCDELGLLVVNEIPGWQHLSKEKIWRDQCYKNTTMMVLTERNHPSVIAHGVRIDESIDDHELYSETNRIAHELDPYRPTIGVRNFTNSELLEDIYGYNDFICDSLNIGLKDPKKIKWRNKSLLVTEYMGHMDPVKPTSDNEKKIEVALRHAKVIDDNLKYENTAGAIGWCFVDYHSHADFGGGDYICPHGVYDLYRNPKYSSYIYASQQDKFPVLQVLSNMKPGDVPEAIFNDIYVATNCDYIELYKNDELVDRFYPKNDVFKYLKHPPILIDDIVGLTFNEKKFPTKMHRKIAKMFSYAAMHGFNHLPVKMKLYLAYTMFRYRVPYSELVFFWNKYVGAWGGKAKTYVIKGYKDGQCVKQLEVGPSTKFDLECSTSKDVLINADTYDTARIRVRHVDEHNNTMDYSQRILEISTKGPIELVGPEHQSLIGGQLTLFIKSNGQKGKGQVTIKMDDIVKTIDFEIK